MDNPLFLVPPTTSKTNQVKSEKMGNVMRQNNKGGENVMHLIKKRAFIQKYSESRKGYIWRKKLFREKKYCADRRWKNETIRRDNKCAVGGFSLIHSVDLIRASVTRWDNPTCVGVEMSCYEMNNNITKVLHLQELIFVSS